MPQSFWTHFGSSAIGIDLMWTHDVSATSLSLKVDWTMNLFGDLKVYEPLENDVENLGEETWNPTDPA